MMAMFLVCCVLIFFVDFIEMLRRAGNYAGDIPGLLLAWMTLLRLPSFSELVLPFAVLIGSIGIFLMLSRSSELVVLRAAGISVWQFTLPAMVVAFLLGVAFVLIYNPIAAVARGEAEQPLCRRFRAQISRCSRPKGAGAWLREDGTDGPSVIHAADVLNQGLELERRHGVPVRSRPWLDRADRGEASRAQGGPLGTRECLGQRRRPGARALQALSAQHLSRPRPRSATASARCSRSRSGICRISSRSPSRPAFPPPNIACSTSCCCRVRSCW